MLLTSPSNGMCLSAERHSETRYPASSRGFNFMATISLPREIIRLSFAIPDTYHCEITACYGLLPWIQTTDAVVSGDLFLGSF